MSTLDLYLQATLARHRVALSPDDRPHQLLRQLTPLLRDWAGPRLEAVLLSGSYAKGTALRDPRIFPSSPDLDLLLSFSPDTRTPLADLHAGLADYLRDYLPQPRNVALRIRFDDTNLDLIPARRRPNSSRHTLWQLRYDTWLETDIDEQIRYIRDSGRQNEILACKLWRRRHALKFPSFLLELAVLHALSPSPRLPLSQSLPLVLAFLASSFPSTHLPDPANSANVVSALLTPEEKHRIAHSAQMSLHSPTCPDLPCPPHPPVPQSRRFQISFSFPLNHFPLRPPPTPLPPPVKMRVEGFADT